MNTQVYLHTILGLHCLLRKQYFQVFIYKKLLFYPFSAVNMYAIFYIKVQLKLSCFKKANAIQSSNKQMIKQLASIVKTN